MVGGCRTPTGGDGYPPGACHQTYEFGNYGCARIVVTLVQPPTPWPARYRINLRIERGDPMFTGYSTVEPDLPWEPALIEWTRWDLPPASGDDTLTVRIVARMLDDPWPPATGPLAVFAADSVLRVLHVAPVGAVPVTDSVALTLRRP